MITLTGCSSGSFSPIIGEVTFSGKPFYDRKNAILVTTRLDSKALGYKGCITSGDKGKFYHPDHIYNFHDMQRLHEGDIVVLNKTGEIIVIWEANSEQNALFLTENCNCNCIMCPQPPNNNKSDFYIEEANIVLDIIKNRDEKFICITGGEPTEVRKDFLKILKRCVDEHPNACINILTNGKNFSDKSLIDEIKKIKLENVVFCVSFHSDVDMLHDYIAGSKGSFKKTQIGLYNLAQIGAKIEIRTVVSRLNFNYLPRIAEHFYNYFPFCVHYAFMGMEVKGLADKNKDKLLISPIEFKQQLRSAVLKMVQRGLNVSIYNLPLCCIDEDVRSYACQSISTWKNSFIDKCEPCKLKEKCAGFFTTSSFIHIDDIKPIA